MCSFLAANQFISNLTFVNFFMQPRGPDATTHTRLHGFDFVHNLLHMTGERRPQPFLGDHIAALFNGEIYNWRSLWELWRGPAYHSDGDAILPAYRAHGDEFPRAFDGEFAVALFDFVRQIAVFATDAFGTKPLWYAVVPDDRRLAVASYKSALLRLGFPAESTQMVGPNRVLTLSLSSFAVLRQTAVFEFDLRQFKRSTDDFIDAFEQAVQKRVLDLEPTRRPLFVGLSSGFDSGAIHAALHRQMVRHHAFALLGEESADLLYSRALFARETSEVSIVVMADSDFEAEERWLSARVEPCAYLGTNFTGQSGVLDDDASVGLSYIARLSRDRGALCYLSGSGADEVLSDYGFQGERLCPQSSFGGHFPGDLAEVFPWQEFFLSTQRDYLFKEEHVAGAHGIEARYPFLDRRVVQEYLWLRPELKNGEYKAPLHDAFVQWGYPFERRQKQGFAARANNIPDNGSVVWRFHVHPPTTCGVPPPAPGVVAWCSLDASAHTSGTLRCEPRCADDHVLVADTLRCGLHGAWVGRLDCGIAASVGVGHAITLWGQDGPPRPPLVVDRTAGG